MLFILAAIIGVAGIALWYLDSTRRKAATHALPEPEATAPQALAQEPEAEPESEAEPEPAPVEDFSDAPIDAPIDAEIEEDEEPEIPPAIDEDFESQVFDTTTGEWAVPLDEPVEEAPQGVDKQEAEPETQPVEAADVELEAVPETDLGEEIIAANAAEPEPEEYLEGDDLTLERPEPGTVRFEAEVPAEPEQPKPALVQLPGAARREKRAWAQERGFGYQRTDNFLTDEWSRGAASTGASAKDVVSGVLYGHEMYLAELGGITVMALRRPGASDVVVDARRAVLGEELESEDLIPVSTVAGFSLFSNDPGAAERMTDTRFRSALAGMPETVTAVWMESDWVLAQTAKGSTHEDWDTMAAMLAVCAAVARVLPPRMGATQAVDFHDCDPSRPLPVPPSYFEDEPEEDLPEMPQITRQDEPVEMPSRSEEISHGVVEPRSIGSQSVEAIAGDDEEATPNSYQGTRIVRELNGRSSIFEDGAAE